MAEQTKALIDPSKPARAVVEVHEDGSATRNDGIKLKAANTNPYYILMTAHGKQDDYFKIDQALYKKNRRMWNAWATQELDDAERTKIAEQLKLEPEELAPLSDDERKELTEILKKRLKDNKAELPDPIGRINLSELYFDRLVSAGRFYFSKWAYFQGAMFSKGAYFQGATFSEDASFEDATFSAKADFKSATFRDWADFEGATFSDRAHFDGATFSKTAHFQGSTFSKRADFQGVMFSKETNFKDATFSEWANFNKAGFNGYTTFKYANFNKEVHFSDSTFTYATSFDKIKFKGYVPKFYQSTIHQDTQFTTDKDYWPNIGIGLRQSARKLLNRFWQRHIKKTQYIKRAYIRFQEKQEKKAYKSKRALRAGFIERPQPCLIGCLTMEIVSGGLWQGLD